METWMKTRGDDGERESERACAREREREQEISPVYRRDQG